MFTDYLDDVSTTYVDQALLLTNSGAKAVELAYRGGELKNGSSYPAAGYYREAGQKKIGIISPALLFHLRLVAEMAVAAEPVRKHPKYGCPANVN